MCTSSVLNCKFCAVCIYNFLWKAGKHKFRLLHHLILSSIRWSRFWSTSIVNYTSTILCSQWFLESLVFVAYIRTHTTFSSCEPTTHCAFWRINVRSMADQTNLDLTLSLPSATNGYLWPLSAPHFTNLGTILTRSNLKLWSRHFMIRQSSTVLDFSLTQSFMYN